MNKTTVYLIDDEPELVDLLSDVVEMSGFSAQGFVQAGQFFEEVGGVFAAGSILVLDLHMPGMDGIEVMRRLADMENPPALILISGHDTGVLHSAEKLGHAHNLEIIASLGKPVPIDRFQQLLQQHAPGGNKNGPTIQPISEHNINTDELERAIRNDQLILHYQPQINIASGALIGVEALVRWQHPELGLVFPDNFIPLAEQSGMMGELTHWVIDRAVRQEQQWQKAGFIARVSVNISAFDITSLTLPEQLAELLSNNRLDPIQLTLEITESALMGELVTSLDILTRLRIKGIGLSIDDFGTGYSSLSQLHRVPFTELKIDRSFVSKMSEDDEARAIVKTCVILGKELNMEVVAEGVETEAHLEMLKQLGCDIAQGYVISKPQEPDKIPGIAAKYTGT
ncbi:MAG: EAL domain-containing protein [Gammaproteobacteria bacterium]|nr:EAL domain-containing protein [Gammaproteobacteria bacterium]